MVQGNLDSSSFNSGDSIPVSAAGPLCAASPPAGEEAPTVNGGQSDSYSESMDREPEPEPAEEVSENGPLLGICLFKQQKWLTDFMQIESTFPLLCSKWLQGRGGKLSTKQTTLYTKWKPDSYLLCPCWCDLEGREEKSWNKWYMIVCWLKYHPTTHSAYWRVSTHTRSGQGLGLIPKHTSWTKLIHCGCLLTFKIMFWGKLDGWLGMQKQLCQWSHACSLSFSLCDTHTHKLTT